MNLKRRTRLVYDDKNYVEAGYLDGTCPNCKSWEAPTTTTELKRIRNPEVYIGSGPILKDKNVGYDKLVWKEYFECPVCRTRFSVRFNDL
jgi:hypothetical protein